MANNFVRTVPGKHDELVAELRTKYSGDRAPGLLQQGCDWPSVTAALNLEAVIQESPCQIIIKKRIGNRFLLQCTHQWSGRPCTTANYMVDTEPIAGFLKPGAAPENHTKARVFVALAELKGWASISQVAIKAGLTVGQAGPVLQRSFRQRYVDKSRDRMLMAVGSAHVYRLAERGQRWLAWACDKGILEEVDAKSRQPTPINGTT
jgi:hypothetical protein